MNAQSTPSTRVRLVAVMVATLGLLAPISSVSTVSAGAAVDHAEIATAGGHEDGANWV